MSIQDVDASSLEVRSWSETDRGPITQPKLALIVGLLGFLAFVPALGNDFVAWDDPDNFINNIGFRGVGWRNFSWAWTSMIIGVYQPIAWMILEVEYFFTGLNPYGYHLASALMHGLNAMILFVLVLKLVERSRPDLMSANPERIWLCSAVAVTLFMVHPMRTEVVAWVSAQPYLPCAFFSMLCVLAYLKANPPGATEIRSRWLLVTFLLYGTAVLSKATAIPLPAVFLVLDVYPLGRLGGDRGWWSKAARRVVMEKRPFFALWGVFMVAAVLARSCADNLDPMSNTGIWGRIALSCHAAMFYPIKSVWPFDIHADYVRPGSENLFQPRFLLALVGTVATTIWIVSRRKQHPGLLASWVAYLWLLAPVSWVITTGIQAAADRDGYLTLMAFVAPMAVAFADLAAWVALCRPLAQAQKLAAVVMVGSLLVLTHNQCRTWKDSEVLWANGIEHGAGEMADLHNKLGVVWASRGYYDLAISAFTEALRLKPGLHSARANLQRAIDLRAKAIGGDLKSKPKEEA